jgi:hypothetical protein
MQEIITELFSLFGEFMKITVSKLSMIASTLKLGKKSFHSSISAL